MKLPSRKMKLDAFLTCLLAAPIVFIITLFLVVPNPNLAAGSDFLSYFTGASIIKNNKASLIYDISTQKQYFENIIYPIKGVITNRFISPPFVALFYLPFSNFNFYISYKLFFLFNLGLFIVLLLLLKKEFKNIKTKYGMAFILPFYFFPVFMTLFMGQTSFILAIVFFLIYKSLKSNNFKFSGILSAALLIKPQYILALPYLFLLAKRKKEFIHSFLGASLVLFFLSVVLVGPTAISRYFVFARSTETPDFGNRAHQMFSVHSATSYLFFSSNLLSVEPLVIDVCLYFLSLFLFYKVAKGFSFNKKFILTILLTLVFGVHVLSHDLIVLIIPIYILLQDFFRNGLESHSLLLISAFLFLLPTTIVLGYSTIGVVAMFFLAFVVLLKKDYLLS